ncbi:hypothetical protein PROVRETT_06197 [Providencia rettgeri DSM 1131]|nr:hypothetical protein PROVRETT_06197 [Providencia rettgeri DSM 1131]
MPDVAHYNDIGHFYFLIKNLITATCSHPFTNKFITINNQIHNV